MKRTHYTPGASTAHGPFCCRREHRPQLHKETSMSDDIESRITKLTLAPGLPREVWSELCRIDSDLRAQRAASRERVRDAVRAVAMTGVCEAIDRMMGPTYWHENPSAHGTFERIADAIADRAAEQLAGQAVSAGLNDQQRAQLVDLLHTDAAHDHPAAEQAIRRMLAGQAAPDPRRGTPSPERAEHEPVNVSRIATFADMARAVIADRLPAAPGLDSDDIAALRWMRAFLDEGTCSHDAGAGRALGLIDRILAGAPPAGHAVALSAVDLVRLRSVRDLLANQPVCWDSETALLDRLLSTPGQGARPAVARIRYTVASPGPSIAEELAEEEAASDSAEQHISAPTPSAVDPALCRRLAALANGSSLQVLPLTTPEREDIARQLTAAADLRDAFNSLQAVAKDAQDQLRAERDRARAAASDAHDDWKGMQAERDAARRESARLAEAFEEATGKLATAVTAKQNAEHDLDAARAECERLSGDLSWWESMDHGSILARLRALLATEPAVSEERCGEIGRVYDVASPVAVPVRLLAAARQLHALRAELREIVGGEPCADGQPARYDRRAALTASSPFGE